MKMKRIILKTFLLLLLFFAYNQLLVAQKGKWKLVENNKEMQVYTRMTDSSVFKELKITVNVPTSLSKIVAVLDDASIYTSWIYSCSKSYTIKQKEKGNFYYYVKLDFPWPLSDRDMVQHSIQTQDTSTLAIEINTRAVSNNIAIDEGVVRILQNDIKWQLIPISKNLTKVHYYVKSNPRGNLPAWLVNMAIDVGPKKSMQAMIKLAKKIEVKKSDIYVVDMK